MSNLEETTAQHLKEASLSNEISEVHETISNENKHALESTQIQIETQQSTELLKQNIDKESFCNYINQNGTPLESQSQQIQELTQQILWPPEETELSQQQKTYNEIKSELINGIKSGNMEEIKQSVIKLLMTFLPLNSTRKINIGNDINYTPNENDKNYLINSICATLDPEKRSRLTYLLGKIKDEEMKEELKEKGVDNPSQFQLFLQNCKPGQLILTNGESNGSSRYTIFSQATQMVSGSRRCHAAVISDIKEENGIITDATIIQASGKGIEETSLKNCFQKNYKHSDLLLGTFQPPNKGEDIISKCKNYIGGKYSQFNLVSDTILDNLPLNTFFHKQKRNKYCSELVFTGMKEAGLELPDPHTTPADLLSTKAITPEYCCYCNDSS